MLSNIFGLFDLSGKKAIVTGGARGIGKAITMALCSVGAQVAVIGSSPDTPERAKQMSALGNKVFGITGDLSDIYKIGSVFDQAIVSLGGDLDILVNNAAVQARYPADEFPLEAWQKIIDVNLTATAMLCQLAGRYMKPKRYGKIINIASSLSFFGGCHTMAYTASKGGVAQLTKALSNEWAPYGINVNSIAPGGFRTEMTDELYMDAKIYQSVIDRTPAGRWGEPEDIAGTIIYLASKASDYVCGIILPLDGGYLVR